MTGSQDEIEELSQEVQNMEVSIRKSPSPQPAGLQTPTAKRRKELLQQYKNSPSAAARVRLLKELKSNDVTEPNLYRDEIELVTVEERELAQKERTLEELFQGISLYIDIRTGEDNRSEGIKMHLRSKGITVTDDITTATHIIFKEGLKTTFKRGKELNLPFVSLLWIDACKKYKALVDYRTYPVRNIEQYEDPVLCKKIRRKRSMQPGTAFVLKTPKRKRNKAKITGETPNIEITPKSSKSKSTKNNSLYTPKSIEVTVRSRTKAHVSTKVKHDGTVFYSSDEMEVSNEQKFVTTPKRKEDHPKNKRQTKYTPKIIEIEKSDQTVNIQEIHIKEQNNILKGPINSTRFTEAKINTPNFEDISPIMLEINSTPSPIQSVPIEDYTEKRKKSVKTVHEETQHIRKSLRKRKLFNPNLTPTLIEHDDKSVAPEIEVPNEPVGLTQPVLKTSSNEAFENQENNCNKNTQTQCQKHGTSKNHTSHSRVFVSSGLENENRKLFKSAIKQISSFTKTKTDIQSVINKNTTHLIVQEPYAKTQKLLLAILHGIWILKINYLKDCLKKKQWLPEEMYEISEFLPGISLSRAERQVFGKNYKMRLFNKKKLYICPNLNAGAAEIREFIELSDGVVTEKIEEAQFQIRDEVDLDCDQNCQISSMWITDSIGAGHLKDVRKYLLNRPVFSQITQNEREPIEDIEMKSHTLSFE
uniref:CSON013513 protein n=1 Tax=Culicoides sonorensis TaxID=179676 RepID=A0A336K1X2_CULSO